MAEQPDLVARWDEAYALGDTSRSWFQLEPASSLRMLDAAGISPGASLIDVGGGASMLVDAVLARGFSDVTVLDLSAAGLSYARRRLGPDARRVAWVVADVLTWRPARSYQVWHDRAVFHFLTTSRTRRQYMQSLSHATTADAIAVFGCFAPEGPRRCSGLPVCGYDPPGLGRQLGSAWSLVAAETEQHVTPAGQIQPFTWAAFRREGDAPG
jgi:hypothetical protein